MLFLLHGKLLPVPYSGPIPACHNFMTRLKYDFFRKTILDLSHHHLNQVPCFILLKHLVLFLLSIYHIDFSSCICLMSASSLVPSTGST